MSNDWYSNHNLFARLAYEDAQEERAANRRRLSVLAHNLFMAAQFERAYCLGYNACTCDVGPSGDEWRSGCGVTPESIADREWCDERHDFEPGDVAAPAMRHWDKPLCVKCGRNEGWHLHRPEPVYTEEESAMWLGRGGDDDEFGEEP